MNFTEYIREEIGKILKEELDFAYKFEGKDSRDDVFVKFYVNPSPFDVEEIDRDMIDKREKNLGERFAITTKGKIYMWTHDVMHDVALRVIKKYHPEDQIEFRITYAKNDDEFWSSQRGYYDTFPDKIKEKLLQLHPTAEFEAS